VARKFAETILDYTEVLLIHTWHFRQQRNVVSC